LAGRRRDGLIRLGPRRRAAVCKRRLEALQPLDRLGIEVTERVPPASGAGKAL
jgi:hypothetical protein